MKSENVEIGSYYILQNCRHQGLTVKITEGYEDEFTAVSVECGTTFEVTNHNLRPYIASGRYAQKKETIEDQIKQLYTLLNRHEEQMKSQPKNWDFVKDLYIVQEGFARLIKEMKK